MLPVVMRRTIVALSPKLADLDQFARIFTVDKPHVAKTYLWGRVHGHSCGWLMLAWQSIKIRDRMERHASLSISFPCQPDYLLSLTILVVIHASPGIARLKIPKTEHTSNLGVNCYGCPSVLGVRGVISFDTCAVENTGHKPGVGVRKIMPVRIPTVPGGLSAQIKHVILASRHDGVRDLVAVHTGLKL